jgi:cytochrome P450
MAGTPEIPRYMVRDRENFGIAGEVAAARDRGELLRTPILVPGVTEAITGGLREAWLVTRHDTVRAVLADHTRFSSDVGKYAKNMDSPPEMTHADIMLLRKGNLLVMDPPEHTRLRGLLLSAFTVNRVRQLTEPITKLVEEYLDKLEGFGRGVDFIANFALPVPSLMICELLGVPYSDRDEFQNRAVRQMDVTLSAEERIELSRAGRAYMRSLVERAQHDPADDLLGALVRGHGDKLDTDTLTNVADLILLAGHQTTASMLGLSAYALLRNPAQLAWLRKNTDRMDAAAEELLRFLSVVSAGPPRIATQDVEVDGTLIRAGELVVLSELAANRDPEFVERPEQLDLGRAAQPHLAFGHGAHRCLGAALARLQLRIAVPALLQRFPDLALAAPAGEIRFRTETVAYGVVDLPITW